MLTGDAERFDNADEDNFSQCGEFWRNVLGPQEKANLIENMSGHLIDAAEFIQERAVANFSKCDVDYGRRLSEALVTLRAQRSNVSIFFKIFYFDRFKFIHCYFLH